jgi:hypothetical protein
MNAGVKGQLWGLRNHHSIYLLLALTPTGLAALLLYVIQQSADSPFQPRDLSESSQRGRVCHGLLGQLLVCRQTGHVAPSANMCGVNQAHFNQSMKNLCYYQLRC